MSDRNQGDVRHLAEEIRQVVEQDWTGHNEHDARLIADFINRFQSEREAALQAQLARALGEGAGLRKAGEALVADPYGCPFCDSGVLRNPSKEHAEDCGFGLLGLALASAPLSERAGEVLKAVDEVVHAGGKEALDAALARLVNTHGALSLALELDADE